MNALVHVLTPCARRENIARVITSIEEARGRAQGVETRLHVLYDDEREHVGGWGLRNVMLDGIQDGWVWLVDDDTLAHPDILRRFAWALDAMPEMLLFLVAQKRPNGWEPGCAALRSSGTGARSGRAGARSIPARRSSGAT